MLGPEPGSRAVTTAASTPAGTYPITVTTTGSTSVVNSGSHWGSYATRLGATIPTNGDSGDPTYTLYDHVAVH